MLRLALLAVATTLAQVAPQMQPIDPRVQLVSYDPNHVVPIGVGIGFASVIELGEDERVENIIVGNSAVWQVTVNRQGDRVVVKPLTEAIPTNMIVLTGSRRYLFMLYPGAGDQFPFVTQFSYPSIAEQQSEEVAVSTYRFRGDRSLFPITMYIEGENTVVTWSKQTALPAVFALQGRSKERLVNGRMVGDNFVIEGTADRYRFRFGDAAATAIRRVPMQRR
ncbi:MAG TPA: TrbG/VirB9 family P-type conjugative transfer protein [Sphingomicrobium sp.]|nr:TrbG/VirB9 family P-type conjugative transfer protein [Sphingomicrobium sp.]